MESASESSAPATPNKPLPDSVSAIVKNYVGKGSQTFFFGGLTFGLAEPAEQAGLFWFMLMSF